MKYVSHSVNNETNNKQICIKKDGNKERWRNRTNIQTLNNSMELYSSLEQ